MECIRSLSSLRRLRIGCSPGVSIAFVLVQLLLLSLGFWQLERALEKQQLIEAAAAVSSITLDISDYSTASLASLNDGDSVILKGAYDSKKTFLLDNQINQGRFGYLVISSFIRRGGGMAFFVVRGWVAGSLDRSRLPDVLPAEGNLSLLAEVINSQGKSFSLSTELATGGWPKVVQSKQVELLSGYLAMASYPQLLWLQTTEEGLERVRPLVVNITPEKHRAYSFQWFVMCLLLLAIYLFNASNIVALLRSDNNKNIEGRK